MYSWYMAMNNRTAYGTCLTYIKKSNRIILHRSTDVHRPPPHRSTYRQTALARTVYRYTQTRTVCQHVPWIATPQHEPSLQYSNTHRLLLSIATLQHGTNLTSRVSTCTVHQRVPCIATSQHKLYEPYTSTTKHVHTCIALVVRAVCCNIKIRNVPHIAAYIESCTPPFTDTYRTSARTENQHVPYVTTYPTPTHRTACQKHVPLNKNTYRASTTR